MVYKTVVVKKEEGVATLLLNRPQRRNAQNDQLLQETAEALEQLAKDDEVRVIVLTGAGDAFCVGAELKMGEEAPGALEKIDAEAIRRYLLWASKTTHLLATMEKPTIAMVNGVAAGGGFDWALACDMRIASEKARFRSYMQIGLVPEEGAWFMTRLMGYAKASEMFLSGAIWDAHQAKEAGLVNKVVPAEELERETMALARSIARNSPTAARLGKLLLRKSLEVDLDTTLAISFAFAGVCMASGDFQEGLSAFREKRRPQYGKK